MEIYKLNDLRIKNAKPQAKEYRWRDGWGTCAPRPGLYFRRIDN